MEMPAEVEYRSEGGFVYMRVHGELTAETAMGMIAQWLALGQQHECRKVLADFREVVMGESITGMYEFVGKMDSMGIPRDMKMANVIRPDDDDNSFFETVARNQGWRFQAFVSPEEAEAWLTAR
jgi:hypothetical protein